MHVQFLNAKKFEAKYLDGQYQSISFLSLGIAQNSQSWLPKMGRELQKKKNKSSVPRARRKPKSKKKILSNPIIAANW